jgi:hypothetical protein
VPEELSRNEDRAFDAILEHRRLEWRPMTISHEHSDKPSI